MKPVLISTMLLLLSACSCPSSTGVSQHAMPTVNSFCERHIGVPQSVELSELLNNGHKYEGKAVSVSGYYSLGFEHSALYPDAGVAPYTVDFSQGIWVDGISPFFDGKEVHVLLTGIYTQKSQGHLAQWPGSLCVAQIRPAS
ncbi:hypothetical protein D3C81_664830 [compost metagenome]